MYKIDDVEFSKETIKAALIKVGHKFDKPKPKFEPISIHDGCFVVSVDSSYDVKIKTGPAYRQCCYQTPKMINEFITALQKAKAHAEANK